MNWHFERDLSKICIWSGMSHVHADDASWTPDLAQTNVLSGILIWLDYYIYELSVFYPNYIDHGCVSYMSFIPSLRGLSIKKFIAINYLNSYSGNIHTHAYKYMYMKMLVHTSAHHGVIVRGIARDSMRFHNPRIASVPRAFRARIQRGICAISRDLSESRAVRVRKLRDRRDRSPSVLWP